jgi:hypothetical protein
MEQILIAIQDQLATVGGLRYIDMDWNQLQMEQPPVQWPCALIDIERVDFTAVKAGAPRAEADITVTVANLRTRPTSLKAPNRQLGHDTLGLLADIHQALGGFDGNGRFRPLVRTHIRKIYGDKQATIHAATYHTVFTDE